MPLLIEYVLDRREDTMDPERDEMEDVVLIEIEDAEAKDEARDERRFWVFWNSSAKARMLSSKARTSPGR